MNDVKAAYELQEHVQGKPPIKAAYIAYGAEWGDIGVTEITLRVGYSEEDYVSFLNALNFEIFDGYGNQCGKCIIWYVDGTWSDRGEYDGVDWWKYNKCPSVYEELR